MIELSLPLLSAAADEVRNSTAYFWDNSVRGDPDSCVIQRTISGEGFFRAGGVEHRAPAGTAMIYTHSEDSCYGYPPGASEPYSLQFIVFSAGCLRPLFDQIRRRFGPLLRLGLDLEAAQLFENIAQLHRARAFSHPTEAAELIFRLLCAIWREQNEQWQERDPVEYGSYLLRNDLQGRLRLKDLPARIGISKEHFIREYTRRHGEPPARMHRRLRLERARAMLSVSTLPIEDVATLCGFGSADTLRRAYRSHFGERPSERRKRAPLVGEE